MCFGITTQGTILRTVRYVSIRVHERIDQGPADDLQGAPQTSFLSLTCESFQEFARAVFSLNTEEEPNYAALQALLTEMVGDRKMSDPYDWEMNYREAIEGVR
ncbi:hypothetical protein OSTOST_23450 [Ostertagia ostertagi]